MKWQLLRCNTYNWQLTKLLSQLLALTFLNATWFLFKRYFHQEVKLLRYSDSVLGQEGQHKSIMFSEWHKKMELVKLKQLYKMHCVQSKPLTQPNLSKQITQSKQVKAHNLNVQLNIKQPTWHLGEKPIRDWPIAALKGFHQGHAAPRTHHQNMQIQPGSRYLLASKVLIIKPFVHTREKKASYFHPIRVL